MKLLQLKLFEHWLCFNSAMLSMQQTMKVISSQHGIWTKVKLVWRIVGSQDLRTLTSPHSKIHCSRSPKSSKQHELFNAPYSFKLHSQKELPCIHIVFRWQCGNLDICQSSFRVTQLAEMTKNYLKFTEKLEFCALVALNFIQMISWGASGV